MYTICAQHHYDLRTMDLDGLRAQMLRKMFPNGTGGVRPQRGGSSDLYPVLMGFLHAVNWREPGVWGPLVFYLVLLIAAVATRNRWGVQLSIFLFSCGAVAVAPLFNKYARAHWRELGYTQNYFDERGIFVITLHCTPLLIIAFVQLLMSFFSAASLLVKAKRMEIQRARKKQAADAAPADVPAPALEAVPAPAAAPKARKRR